MRLEVHDPFSGYGTLFVVRDVSLTVGHEEWVALVGTVGAGKSALMGAIELRHSPFIFWITDLSAMDGLYVLPVLMGGSMFFQQKLTSTSLDPIQAKIMLWMPVIFTFFMLNFPAGLTLYWFTSNLLSILQQLNFAARSLGRLRPPLRIAFPLVRSRGLARIVHGRTPTEEACFPGSKLRWLLLFPPPRCGTHHCIGGFHCMTMRCTSRPTSTAPRSPDLRWPLSRSGPVGQ